MFEEPQKYTIQMKGFYDYLFTFTVKTSVKHVNSMLIEIRKGDDQQIFSFCKLSRLVLPWFWKGGDMEAVRTKLIYAMYYINSCYGDVMSYSI